MKKVLVCPLDWGIGHATRCVPIIRILREEGFEVIIAADNRPLDFLLREFPGIRLFRFPGTRIRYPKSHRMALKMLRLAPSLLRGIWQEHKIIRHIVDQTGADLIISDNRYGCWCSGTSSIIITHQLNIQVPSRLKFLQHILNRISNHFIGKFDECWIPDFELHKGLASDLSHPAKLPAHAHYIGILSRFAGRVDPHMEMAHPDFEILVMLSGPEPQRTLLEERIIAQLLNVTLRTAIVRGVPETEEEYVVDGRIHIFSHLETERMKALILSAELIICRSGYSSIMDLVTLGKRAIFIPTPGQTEQECLAKYLMERKIYFSMEQKDFDLLYAIEMSKNFPGMVMRNNFKTLKERITAFASKPDK
jgi:uncharacterized protein (TIGR00661 family)